MARRSESRLLVLHTLRLKGVARVETVAEAAELTPTAARTQLRALDGEGLVRHRDGALTGWSLTPAGRIAHERLLATEANGVRPRIAEAYERFRLLNPALLDLCSRWQVRSSGRSPVLNDHSDPAYDADVVDDLTDFHGEAAPVCDDLAATLGRYRSYGPRLGHALTRVRAGDIDYFTKPVIPSYHTVWFELHEDLLATLGIDRAAEVQGAS